MLVLPGRARRVARRASGGQRGSSGRSLTDDPLEQAELHERAGGRRAPGRTEAEQAHFAQAIELFGDAARPARRARGGRLGEVIGCGGRLDEGIDSNDRSYACSPERSPTRSAESRRSWAATPFAGNTSAPQRLESALHLAEGLALPRSRAGAQHQGDVASSQGRHHQEASPHMRHALDMALDNDLGNRPLRAYNLVTLLNAERPAGRG